MREVRNDLKRSKKKGASSSGKNYAVAQPYTLTRMRNKLVGAILRKLLNKEIIAGRTLPTLLSLLLVAGNASKQRG